jgi:DNA-binding CsgD family transcriptional regulator/tetratricopeptide (TPR) repeat protein
MIRIDYSLMPALPGPLRLTPFFPFAGRSRELNALRALVPGAEGEGRRAALLAGEPGSGKSRLVRELAHDVAREDGVVLYGACDAVRTPYGPFVEALDHLARHHEQLDLGAALETDGAELVRLIPGLPALVGSLPPRRESDPDTERHRLHSAVVRLLTAAGERRPVLLLLEDVHWADTPTLLLIRHLVRAGMAARMLMLATFREADMPAELSETLVEVGRTEGVVRMRLAGLSSAEVAEFVRLTAGVEPTPELTSAICRLTGGNAFLVTELWRELVDSDAVEVGADDARLVRSTSEIGTPETVREVVNQRLARLDPATTELLRLAAIAGSDFDLGTVRRASGLAEGTLLDAVDEAVQSGLLVEVPARGLAYRFAHELVRRALLDRLAAPRRAALHLRVAESLEQARPQGGNRNLADLAHHFAEAAPIGGAERAIAYNVRVGEAAAASLAFDEAIASLRVALDLGIEDVRERARVSLELGNACHKAGRAVDALEAFVETVELARSLDDCELLTLAAIGFEEACWRPGIADAGAVELLEEAAAMGVRGTELRVRLLGGLARALDFRGERERGAAARDEAIALAREGGDRRGLAAVLAAAYWSRGTSTVEETFEMLTEAKEIGQELGDAELRGEAMSWRVPTFVALCDHDGARRELAELFDVAGRLNEPFRLHVAEHYASALALCDGDLVAAEAAALRSEEWGRLLAGRDASGVHGIQMFSIRREQGRLAELAPLVRVIAGDGHAGSWAPGLIVLLAELGMVDEARRELRRVAGRLDELRPSLWLLSLAYLADACAALADEELASVVYAELEPYAGNNVMIGHLVSCYGSADRYLGTLSAVLRDWERAQRHFESALALNRRLGARTWLAHTAFEYARMLLARRAGDDRAQAAALLSEAARLANATDMRALKGRIARLGPSVTVPISFPDGLSRREVEILRLVARGLSNRDIGTELTISEHTAANHVRSILRKTGCANRTEATTYAHRRGLVSA